MAGREFWPGEQNDWLSSNYHTYVRLRPDADVPALEAKLKGILEKYFITAAIDAGMANANEILEKGSFELQPIADIHLRSDGIQDRMTHGDIRFVWLFGAIAGFILLIAGINF